MYWGMPINALRAGGNQKKKSADPQKTSSLEKNQRAFFTLGRIREFYVIHPVFRSLKVTC